MEPVMSSIIGRLGRKRLQPSSVVTSRINKASILSSPQRPFYRPHLFGTELQEHYLATRRFSSSATCAGRITLPSKISCGQNRRKNVGGRCFSGNTATSNESDYHQSKESRQESILASFQSMKDSEILSQETEFSTNPYELDRHGKGESHHRGYTINDDGSHDNYGDVTPDVIVRPQTVQDVSAILSFCNDNQIPVIPYGAGTSVEGHVCAIQNGTISLDMNAFQDIVLPGEEDDEMDEETALLPDPIAKVGAGVTRKALNEALRHTGMQFVVDPGADASLGGMVATGASGTTAVRYGTMRENILELECVLADGTIVKKVGTKALKSSAGYDLLGLMCGSEVSTTEWYRQLCN